MGKTYYVDSSDSCCPYSRSYHHHHHTPTTYSTYHHPTYYVTQPRHRVVTKHVTYKTLVHKPRKTYSYTKSHHYSSCHHNHHNHCSHCHHHGHHGHHDSMVYHTKPYCGSYSYYV